MRCMEIYSGVSAFPGEGKQAPCKLIKVYMFTLRLSLAHKALYLQGGRAKCLELLSRL